MILCNPNSLGSVQKQDTTISPVLNHKTFTQKSKRKAHLQSEAKCLHFEAAMPTADLGYSATQDSWRAKRALGICK